MKNHMLQLFIMLSVNQDNPEIFKVMDKAKDDKYAYIIYRVSDLAEHADFSINNGDAEFALIVDKN